MPAQPPMAASRKLARLGHWSLPSAAAAGGGANHAPTFLSVLKIGIVGTVYVKKLSQDSGEMARPKRVSYNHSQNGPVAVELLKKMNLAA